MSNMRNLSFVVDEETHEYLTRSACIRGISIAKLLRRLAYHICRDELVLAILDDNSRDVPVPGEQRRHRPRDHLYDSLRH